MEFSNLSLRKATNADVVPVVALIESILAEHDDPICLETTEADLLDIEQNYIHPGGEFWVLICKESGKESIVGTHSAMPFSDDNRICTFKRLYLHIELRGTKWSNRLMQVAIDWAIEQEYSIIEFWSDTRFERAHGFFQKFGFKKTGVIQECETSYGSFREYQFRKVLQ